MMRAVHINVCASSLYIYIYIYVPRFSPIHIYARSRYIPAHEPHASYVHACIYLRVIVVYITSTSSNGERDGATSTTLRGNEESDDITYTQRLSNACFEFDGDTARVGGPYNIRKMRLMEARLESLIRTVLFFSYNMYYIYTYRTRRQECAYFLVLLFLSLALFLL